jgi:hypothetical protein
VLTYIHEVTSSNLDRDTDYPDWGFSWFPSVTSSKWLGNTLK